MRVIKANSYEDMSQLCAHIVISTMLQDQFVNISLTAGETPKYLYEILVKEYQSMPNLIDKVRFFGFDECFIEGKGITLAALSNQIYDKINVPQEHIFAITKQNYLEYDTIIESQGGIDLMVIGLGADGHFCGNMPDSTQFERGTHRVKIEKDYSWYSSMLSFFDTKLPKYLYTMGPRSIMKVKHLVLIVSGDHKKDAFKRMIDGEISTNFPASILKMHPNLTVIVDEDASKLIS